MYSPNQVRWLLRRKRARQAAEDPTYGTDTMGYNNPKNSAYAAAM